MAIELKMPALSPTMEEGTLARWLVKPGDTISSGDIMAEIETDKATMEFEAVDEGVLAAIVVADGTENVQVGTVIAMLAEEGEELGDISAPVATPAASGAAPEASAAQSAPAPAPSASQAPADSSTVKASPLARRIAAQQGVDLASVSGTGPRGRIVKADLEMTNAAPSSSTVPTNAATANAANLGERVIASPLARRLAGEQGIDLALVTGTGPGGRVVKADVDGYVPAPVASSAAQAGAAANDRAPAATQPATEYDAPYEAQKMGNVRKVIARRLTEAKQQIPHIYLTVDVRLDPLLELRKQLNAALEDDGVKLSVNDLVIKALARSLMREPQCNVSFQGDVIHQYTRADISVAVAAPTGLITPIIRDAGAKSLAEISTEMKELAGKAREGKLKPHEFQGGTASLSNLGMFGTKSFDAVINPPQAMILAVGAGEQRPYVVDGELSVATVMSVTGSFDHRAIDGVDGAKMLDQFRSLIENPIGLVV